MTLSTTPRRRGTLIAAFSATFIALLDLTIVAVALPAMQTDLHTTITGSQWIVDAFSICLAACMLSGGSLGDRYGRKRWFLIGMALFLAGSLLCALAPTLGYLVAGRAVQGMAAALLVPGALSIIGQAEPDPVRRARLLGYWGMCASAAVLAGPIIGGLLVDGFGWPAIFLVNLPIGAAAILLGRRTIDESADPDHAALDPAGQALGIVTLAILIYAIIETRANGWGSLITIILLALAVAAGTAFVIVEWRQATPMLPVRLLADRRFASVNAASVLLGFGANGAFTLLSLYLQQAQGHSALATGLLLAPMTVAIMPASVLAGRLTASRGPRLPMLLGYALIGASLLGLATLDIGRSLLATGALFVLCGIGQGLAITPAVAAALQLVPRQRSGVASATVNTARQAGSALGIAVLGTILSQSLANADPTTFQRLYGTGMRDVMLTAGTAVLAGALLLALQRGWRPATADTHEPQARQKDRIRHTP
ncbi:MFS transporter [Nonomuraea jabiensis]|uniref:EmrB/QacA subfamily drug resistance transporter n=1 Tax=Nonomuraea jabiensis TaxID=882448 RepID=A0A7W9GD58_9ACTN|nr:MFS transporter [Nonomuraea jabiensis]MBB5781606.1 EmrB/QacA subfamily drug resistance transporter [Nonomuraea jabiensis]